MLLVEFFPGFNPFFIGARIVNGGKAVGEEFILGQEDDFLKLLFSVGRNGLVKRFLGLAVTTPSKEPSGLRRYSPPTGSGVSFVTPTVSKALLLTQAP